MLAKIRSFGKAKLGVLLFMATAMLAHAEADTAAINKSMRDVAESLDAISGSVTTIIGPAMIGLVVALTLLVIVVRIAKKPRSAG